MLHVADFKSLKMDISQPVDIAVEPQSVVGVTFDGRGQALVTTFDKIVKFESDTIAGILVRNSSHHAL